MKKLLKCVVFTAGLLAIPAAINHYIFKRTAHMKPSGYYRSFYYNWRYGKIRYVVAGHGSPILLLHGFGPGANSMEWKRNIEALSKSYRVFVPDLLGFGYSDKPDTTYSAYLYASFINDFIKNVIGEQVGIVANGLSAAHAVAAYDFEPSLYKKMVLIAPDGIGTRQHMPAAKCVWLRWLLQSPLLGTSIYNIMTSRCFFKWSMQRLFFFDAAMAKRFIDAHYTAAHYGGHLAKLSFAAYATAFLNVNITHMLERINIPIRLLWGKNNMVNPIQNAQQFIKQCPHATLAVSEDAKCYPHIECPDQFNNLCKAFFRD